MSSSLPHYVLFSMSAGGAGSEGRWSFCLQPQDGSRQVKAADVEPELRGERLELLSIVRGLEALDEPSAVTLVTDSSYAYRGMAHGMDQWRADGWTWEAFGKMVPVKNRDLWQRIDRAMTYHKVDPQRRLSRHPQQSVPAPHFPMARRTARSQPEPVRTTDDRIWIRIERFVRRVAARFGCRGWAPTVSGSY